MKSFCTRCKCITNQAILAEHYIKEDDPLIMLYSEEKYQIIKCMGCDLISFRKLYSDNHMIADAASMPYEFDDPWTQTLYPSPNRHMKEFINVPKIVLNIYKETIKAFSSNQLLLCAAGLRSIIEGICNDKEIYKAEEDNGKNVSLYRKIDGLAEEGLLTKKNSDILHNLRFLGNIAVHKLESPTIAELNLAITILEHLMENIYELLPKAELLTEEIAKRKS